MLRRLRTSMGILALVAVAILLSACTFKGDTMTIDPGHSPENKEIWGLYSIVWWLALMIFILVEVALFYAIFRFRRRPGQGLPRQTHGNNRLEVAWTIAPALLLVFVAIPTVRIIINQSAPAGPDAVHVRIIGHQFWWEAQYLDYPDAQGNPLRTANEIHVPVGKEIEFQVTSADVQHSFWCPCSAARSMLCRPASTTSSTPHRRLIATFQCAELCGTAHGFMKFYLVVDTQADFDTRLKGQQTAVQAATTDPIKQGEQLVTTLCAGCHYIQGTSAQGRVGPNLTGFGNRQTMAAGWVPTTEENIKTWVHNPGDIKPGAVADPSYSDFVNTMRMPAFNTLTDEQLTAIAKYLLSLK
ncbi:MAG: cytochrome c oxidase subunit II [Thermomicrobiales bacterium]